MTVVANPVINLKLVNILICVIPPCTVVRHTSCTARFGSVFTCLLRISEEWKLFSWRRVFTARYKAKDKPIPLRPGVARRVGRGIALLFHDRGTRRGWVVSSTPRPQFTPGKDPVLILQEAGWALGPVWTGGKSRPHRDSIPDRPARSQSLYRLSYPAHVRYKLIIKYNTS